MAQAADSWPYYTLEKVVQSFYKRQFINREQLSGTTVTEFNKIVQNYIKDGSLDEKGLPSVGDLASFKENYVRTFSFVGNV